VLGKDRNICNITGPDPGPSAGRPRPGNIYGLSPPPTPALVIMPITEKTPQHQKMHTIYYRFIKNDSNNAQISFSKYKKITNM